MLFTVEKGFPLKGEDCLFRCHRFWCVRDERKGMRGKGRLIHNLSDEMYYRNVLYYFRI